MNRLQHLDISTVPLEGSNLIEASAGTGKTWSIASLYLRLLLEKEIPIGNILVVTYTRAATLELRQRIFDRLHQALEVVNSNSRSDDQVLQGIMQTCQDQDRSQAILRIALANFDEAAIFTIHGFCQRALSDGAFESELPFDLELLSDETELLKEVITDFWRQEIYTAENLWVGWLQSQGISGPDDLLDVVRNLIGKPYLSVEQLPKPQRRWLFETEVRETFQDLSILWPAERESIIGILETDQGLNRRVYPRKRITEWSGQMDLLLSPCIVDYCFWKAFKSFKRFQMSHLESDTALKKHAKPPDHRFFYLCDKLANCFNNLDQVYKKEYSSWRLRLFRYVANEISLRKMKEHQISYDDLLIKMQETLAAPSGKVFAERLRSRYGAILLDEFQDTDPIQYEVFKTICADSGQVLFMVGDPKQAIYSFRGADIFSYLAARQDVSNRYTLDENHRSAPGLVAAVNALFGHNLAVSPFVFEDIQFNSAMSSSSIPEITDERADAPFVIWQIPSNDPARPMPKHRAMNLCSEAVSKEVIRLLSSKEKIGNSPIKLSDIAILVRTHHEGRVVDKALHDVHLPTERFVQESVYETAEADELGRVLIALAHPGREALVRSALVTDFFGYDVQELTSITELGQPWDDRLAIFHSYHDRWRDAGFMRMFRELIAKEGVVKRLLSYENGQRRVTNLMHLAEQISARFCGHNEIVQALKWFSQMRMGQMGGDEESLLRLESNQDRVRIVTLHASKGLQYPVVFLPFVWNGDLRMPQQEQFIFHGAQRNHLAAVDFGSENFAKHLSSACNEELAENLRLLYVGVTRAQSRCYIAWGAVKGASVSPLAWLLHRPQKDVSINQADALANHFSTLSENELTEALKDLVAHAKGSIVVEDLPVASKEKYRTRSIPSSKLSARRAVRQVVRTWRVSSFTALVAGREIDLPDRDAQTNDTSANIDQNAAGIFSFPRGARSGTCIHQIFEEIDFSPKKGGERRVVVERKLQLHGFNVNWTDVICNMLDNVLTASLDAASSISLGGVSTSSRIEEMAFYYPTMKLRAKDLEQALSKYNFVGFTNDREKHIDFETLSGFIHGYIDLVFKSPDSRFFIVDYKSNHLGSRLQDYEAECLLATMVRENYSLQYLLYTIAIHRYLGRRVVDYDYDRHFGGVYYLFVRGMDPSLPGNGVFFDKPSRELIEVLDDMIVGHD